MAKRKYKSADPPIIQQAKKKEKAAAAKKSASVPYTPGKKPVAAKKKSPSLNPFKNVSDALGSIRPKKKKK